jgi:excisionase family DNA binding protein
MRQLLDLKQTAAILNISYARAADLARAGLLPVVRLGRQVRVDPQQLETFIAHGGKNLPGGWRRA